MKVKPQTEEKLFYELGDISPSNRWICMTDGSYRVHPRNESLMLRFFDDHSIKAVRRKPLFKINFIDYLNKIS